MALSGAVALTAQEPPVRALGAPERVSGEFSEISALRELSDGRLLLLDAREQVLQLLDPRTGKGKRVGAIGSGPGEFRRATGLLAAPGDTTWVVDAGNGRLLVVGPDGSIPGVVSQWPERQMTITLATGSDRLGHLYGTAPLMTAPGSDPTVAPDSQALVRVVAATGVGSRVVSLATPPSRITVRRSGEKIESVEIRRPPFAVGDQFAVAKDGRVAIARRAPYRLDVVSPSGVVVQGPVVSVARVPVGEQERAEYLDGLPRAARARPDAFEWPEELPVFPLRPMVALLNGETWVRRNVPAASSTAWYDVFDRRGVRIARVVVTRNRRILAVTGRGTWVALTDDDGLQHLELYPAVRDAAQ